MINIEITGPQGDDIKYIATHIKTMLQFNGKVVRRFDNPTEPPDTSPSCDVLIIVREENAHDAAAD